MRLRRIEAVRYGRLAGDTLGDLGDGLTVVQGPNEAGKSTFTSLVRHVLYGYPTQRQTEPGYFVGGDGRLARLVFDDEAGEWVVERAEGAHGGDVKVRALVGTERPRLVDELTRGVSALAYKVVFGFGLDEMSGIEEMRGSNDDIIARLYAASAGLRISPHEVRTAIESDAGVLFKAGARKREINGLVGDLRAARKEAGELQRQAESFALDQQRLHDLGGRLAEARDSRDATRARATGIGLALERADGLHHTLDAQDETLLELRRERRGAGAELETLQVDDALLAAGPDLDALFDEAARCAATADSLAEAEAALAVARARAQEAADETGLDDAAREALARTDDAGTIERARDEIARLQLAAETREEEVARALGELAAVEEAAASALNGLGLPAEGARDAIEERLAAIEALEVARGGAIVMAAHGDVPALIMLVSGIAAIATGAYLAQWISVGIGAVLVIAGAWFLFRARRGAAGARSAEDRTYLRVLELEHSPNALELSRLRRALEAARSVAKDSAEVGARAAEAEREAALARDALATRRQLWSAWLTERGLDPALEPATVTRLLGLARDARRAAEVRDEAEREVAAKAARLDDFAARLAGAARPFVAVPEQPTRADIPVVASRLRERLVSARESAGRRADLERTLSAFDVRIESEEERAAKARDELREVLARFGLEEGGTREDLRAMKLGADATAAEAEAAFDEIAQGANQLAGRLENEARERRGGELRLKEAGIAERLADAVDRYLVLATAARLLADAQARYERDRQPEVVKHAGRLFSTMTDGRYTGLTIPLGDGRIEVFDRNAGAKTSELLSRGTAEQLYLALRLGLIAQLGAVGAGLPVLMDDVLVNFDPERRRGAASAVAELAASRQVVFFTCHPETAALFSEVMPGHTHIDLARCDR